MYISYLHIHAHTSCVLLAELFAFASSILVINFAFALQSAKQHLSETAASHRHSVVSHCLLICMLCNVECCFYLLSCCVVVFFRLLFALFYVANIYIATVALCLWSSYVNFATILWSLMPHILPRSLCNSPGIKFSYNANGCNDGNRGNIMFN